MSRRPNLGPLRRCRLHAATLLLLTVGGCADTLNTEYGSRTGLGSSSINGISVLADMFAAAGHHVSTASALTPKLRESADTIVWFPDEFQPPSQKVRLWFENWLCDEPGRTLIYVGRDYEATATYWRTLAATAPPVAKAEFERRAASATNDFRVIRHEMPERENAGWFRVRGKLSHRLVRTLDGSARWLAGIDPARLEIELNGRLLPGRDAKVLLKSDGDALVMRRELCGNRLLIVTNGSFLLNLCLVNHEHRKLAGKLIDEVDETGRVAFLESGPYGVKIYEDDEPGMVTRTGLEIFGVEPFNKMLLQLAVAGAIFCFARLPIFGRPQPWIAPRLSDFGQHVRAFGRLLAGTRDRAFAQERLLHYEQASHGEGKRAATPRRTPTTKHD